jgi:hypothetical protein
MPTAARLLVAAALFAAVATVAVAPSVVRSPTTPSEAERATAAEFSPSPQQQHRVCPRHALLAAHPPAAARA